MTAREPIHPDSEPSAPVRWLAVRRQPNAPASDALADRNDDPEQSELVRAMREGYESVGHERVEIDSEWQATETEHWPS